jgi:hypothetical protein
MRSDGAMASESVRAGEGYGVASVRNSVGVC